MDTFDIVKLAFLFFGSTGCFVLYVKYRVLSKTGPLNGAVTSIDRIEKGMGRAEERRQEDHDILVRVAEKADGHEEEIKELRKFKHEFPVAMARVETKVDHLGEDLTAFIRTHEERERAGT